VCLRFHIAEQVPDFNLKHKRRSHSANSMVYLFFADRRSEWIFEQCGIWNTQETSSLILVLLFMPLKTEMYLDLHTIEWLYNHCTRWKDIFHLCIQVSHKEKYVQLFFPYLALSAQLVFYHVITISSGPVLHGHISAGRLKEQLSRGVKLRIYFLSAFIDSIAVHIIKGCGKYFKTSPCKGLSRLVALRPAESGREIYYCKNLIR
jgi:hypothetical protein